MTIKDILDTPISEMWNGIAPYAIVYLIIFGVVTVIAVSFIVWVFINIIKGRRRTNNRRKSQSRGRWE